MPAAPRRFSSLALMFVLALLITACGGAETAVESDAAADAAPTPSIDETPAEQSQTDATDDDVAAMAADDLPSESPFSIDMMRETLQAELDGMSPEEREAFKAAMQGIREAGDPKVLALCDEVFVELEQFYNAAVTADVGTTEQEYDQMLSGLKGLRQQSQGTELEQPVKDLVRSLDTFAGGDQAAATAAGSDFGTVCVTNGWLIDTLE